MLTRTVCQQHDVRKAIERRIPVLLRSVSHTKTRPVLLYPACSSSSTRPDREGGRKSVSWWNTDPS